LPSGPSPFEDLRVSGAFVTRLGPLWPGPLVMRLSNHDVIKIRFVC
jgi:hypothetical protein